MNGRDGKNSNRSATKMSETKTAEEPFFACLRTLKTLLQPQSPLPEISVHIRASQQTTRSIARDHPRNEGTAPPESPVSPQHAEALSALQSKLHAAEETARKERTFRLSVEKEREDLVAAGRLLNEKLETKSASKVPWRDDINYLKKENERLRTAREEERKKHFEEMDHVHEQLQSAISQRDSMEARLLGNRTFIDELQAEARKAQYEIQSQEQLHTDTMQSLQNQNNNLSISVEKLHHTIVAIQNEV